MIPWVRGYYPLAATRFIMALGSPYQRRFDSGRGSNYRTWDVLVPPALGVCFSHREHEPSGPGLAEAVERLVAACQSWRDHYFAMKRRGVRLLLASMPDSEEPDGVIVIDYREAIPTRHVLRGTEAAVHRFFDGRRSVVACHRTLGHIPTSEVDAAIQRLVERRLLYRRGDQALSLAIRGEPDSWQGALSLPSEEWAQPDCDGQGGSRPAAAPPTPSPSAGNGEPPDRQGPVDGTAVRTHYDRWGCPLRC